MRKKLFLLSALCFSVLWILFSGCAAPQIPAERPLFKADAPAELQAPISQHRQEIAPGAVHWDLRYESLFGGVQSIQIIRIDWQDGNWETVLSFCGKRRSTVPAQAKSLQADIAINGTFFAYSKVPRSVELLKIGGKVLSPKTPRRGHGMVAFDKAGDFPVIGENLEANSNALQAHPMLVEHGRIVNADRSKGRHPRSLIGVTPYREVILAVVDGRNKANAKGVTLMEAAQLMHALGCSSALNLDGGGSSTLYTKRFGVINHPSDNKKFDHAGARAVNDAICFRRR